MTDEVQGAGEGGESACFAHLVCPECGVLLDGSAHSNECRWETPTSDTPTANTPETNA